MAGLKTCSSPPLAILSTTAVGSYPRGRLSVAAAIRRAVADQREAGLDLLTDGQVRADMLGLVLNRLPGVPRPSGRGAGAAYAVSGRLRPPPQPLLLPDYRLACSLATPAPVKAVVTGPTTLALACRAEAVSPYPHPAFAPLARDLAAIVAAEVTALVAAGAQTVQLDEPALPFSPDVTLSLALIARSLRGVPQPALHVCGDIRPIYQQLLSADVAQLSVEGSHPWRLPPFARRDLLAAGKKLVLGAISTQTT
ncbi:MAG: hypothetical protein HYY05_03400, partial [Chloroflexi bacterium]|nr:hypothetical protein [Chloroflexota bacterium]